ncbi:MAG: ABC transporter ATP-binding protein [Rhodospirillales bacterium]|nr:ABC transporter ATP-binding protein [Rhodospirillales bacterium]
MSLLVVEGLRKAFGGVRAVDGISFRVEAGESVAIIGSNGAGKTTCFNMLCGQLKPDAGRIMLAGRDIAGLSPHRIWRRGLSRTFQVAATFRSMRVRENVQLALLSHRRRTHGLWRPVVGLPAAEADALLAQVGLAARAEQPVAALPYADRKRLEVAMALANAPRLLLLDEPTAGVAAGERRALMDLISDLVRTRNIGVLFTEHDMDVVFGHGERVIVLHEGRLVAEGPPEAIRADPIVREIYLGTGEQTC